MYQHHQQNNQPNSYNNHHHPNNQNGHQNYHHQNSTQHHNNNSNIRNSNSQPNSNNSNQHRLHQTIHEIKDLSNHENKSYSNRCCKIFIGGLRVKSLSSFFSSKTNKNKSGLTRERERAGARESKNLIQPTGN